MKYRFDALTKELGVTGEGRAAWVECAVICLGLGAFGCASPAAPLGPNSKGVPFENLTLQNAFNNWPSGAEYIEGTGSGRPPEDEKKIDLRRKASREAAGAEAQKQLIAQLEKLVPRNQIRDLLKKVEIAKLEYTYDDGCVITLRIPKEAVVGRKPIEE